MSCSPMPRAARSWNNAGASWPRPVRPAMPIARNRRRFSPRSALRATTHLARCACRSAAARQKKMWRMRQPISPRRGDRCWRRPRLRRNEDERAHVANGIYRGKAAMNVPMVRLTSLAHGGGCGCKLAPSDRQLLVGTETPDDAAVWQLDDGTCVIATTDFFTPVVDDPYDFGRIAATNAISDVYAMGGKPIMALAILGIPVDKIAPETVREILKGGTAVCASAGIPVAGGHSIDSPEPIYGLAVIGICKTEDVRRKSDAKPGDAIILTKPLGVGIYSAAIKKGVLSPAGYAEMIATTTLLNRVGAELAKDAAVHAITDVTGFGLLGHGLEMARCSGLTLVIRAGDLPLLSE